MTYLPWGRIAASAAIIEGGRILLLKRVSSARTYPDYWTFPSGGIEDTDLTISSAVVREVAEETGLLFEPKSKFGFYEVIVDNKRCMALVHLGTYKGEVVIQPSEIAEYAWCTFNEAMERPLAFAYKEVITDLYNQGLII